MTTLPVTVSPFIRCPGCATRPLDAYHARVCSALSDRERELRSVPTANGELKAPLLGGCRCARAQARPRVRAWRPGRPWSGVVSVDLDAIKARAHVLLNESWPCPTDRAYYALHPEEAL